MAASWSGPQEGQPNTRSRRDVSRPRQAPLGRFPSTLSAENRRPTGYQQLLTQHGVGDRRCEIRLTQESPIQDLLGARRPPPGRENVGKRVTGRRWWPILPSGGRTEVGTNQVIGS